MNNFKPSVPQPCHQDWNAMTPDSKGRFCGSCEKSVVDFTGMDDSGIHAYLLLHHDKNVCGRFNQEQLDMVVIPIPRNVLFGQTQFRKIFLLALLVTMGSMLFSCNGMPVMGKATMDTTDTIAAPATDSIPVAAQGPTLGTVIMRPTDLKDSDKEARVDSVPPPPAVKVKAPKAN